jgi:mannose-6-phosphate isomerase-like protein (cupin superfamily)
MEIKKEFCGIIDPECAGEDIVRKPLMVGEIAGLEVTYVQLPKESTANFNNVRGYVNILLIIDGDAGLSQSGKKFKAGETAVFVPSTGETFSVSSSQTAATAMLRLKIQLSDEDLNALEENADLFPWFRSYSDCPTYKESIKSEKTLSRMILPEDIVPRFCMGSVQTNGPDAVGAHSHPMLEQLFFGLPGNHCTVHTDDSETEFKENFILHIPLGSMHGASVDEGNGLNYIWMDLFRSMEDMSYIKDNHLMEE